MSVAIPRKRNTIAPGYTYVPADDPVPWITERMVRAGALDRKTGDAYSDRTHIVPVTDAVTALLDILTQTVSALHDDERPFQVVLSKTSASAATSLEAKLVKVGSLPWLDKDITDGQRAAVMAGLVLHEIGHIRFSRRYTLSVNRLFGGEANVTNAIRVISNLAADCHDENAAATMFPGLKDAVDCMVWWAGNKGIQSVDMLDVQDRLNGTTADRVNLAISAARYPWQCDFTSTPDAIRWADWWADWADRATVTGEPAQHAQLVKEGIDYCRSFTPTPPPPEPEDEPPVDEPGDDEEPPEEPPTDGPDEPPTGPGGDEPPPIDDDPRPPRGNGPSQPPIEQPPMDDGEKPEPPTDEPPRDGPKGEPTDEPGEDEGPDDDGPEKPGWDGKETPDDEEPPKGEGPKGHGNPVTERPDEPTPGTTASESDTVIEPEDRSENDSSIENPCAADKASDEWTDDRFQSQYEANMRGKREGMRKRTYNHKSSYQGRHTVTLVPRKGSRWVNDA